jgi:ComF family protein
MLELPQTDYHTELENPLRKRLSYRIPVKYALALFKFSKNGRVQHLLHELKYRNHPEIGEALGRAYGDKMRETNQFQELDIIIPVPLHPSRKRKRGYNQSARFASGLSEKLGVPFSDDLMARRIVTGTQTLKTKLTRWESMSGVFSVKESAAIHNKNILLVDDVVTTGSTLEACAEPLLRAGCKALSIACIAEA